MAEAPPGATRTNRAAMTRKYRCIPVNTTVRGAPIFPQVWRSGTQKCMRARKPSRRDLTLRSEVSLGMPPRPTKPIAPRSISTFVPPPVGLIREVGVLFPRRVEKPADADTHALRTTADFP